MSYIESFRGRSDTIIENITVSDDELIVDHEGFELETIDFAPYGNPNVGVSASTRYAVHEIIGGTTVRQKIGEDPREIEISGVCTEPIAQDIAKLHRAELCSVNSDVLGEIVRCNIASTSTDPLDDGGAADMDGGEFLYDYSISLVEIDRRGKDADTAPLDLVSIDGDTVVTR